MYTLTLRYLHYFNIRINNRYLFLPQVFLKYYHTEQLDAVMLSCISKVVICQKYSRGLLARKLYKGMKDAKRAERSSQVSSMCHCVRQVSSSTAEILRKLNTFDIEQQVINIIIINIIWLHLDLALKTVNVGSYLILITSAYGNVERAVSCVLYIFV